MNKLLNMLGVGAIALATMRLVGCKEDRKEYSEVKHEKTSVELDYHAAHDEMELKYDFGYQGFGKFHIGKFYIDYVPAEYNVTFSGQIKFHLDNEKIFNRFKNKSSLAEVSYRERYLSTYDNLDRDGKKELVKRTLEGYRFIDAQPINK